MAECNFREHDWKPQSQRGPSEDVALFACNRCGVGNEVRYDKRTPGQIRTSLRVFPATGSTTVSRAIIRFAVMSHEANLNDMRAAGVTVVDEPLTLDGEPTGQ